MHPRFLTQKLRKKSVSIMQNNTVLQSICNSSQTILLEHLAVYTFSVELGAGPRMDYAWKTRGRLSIVGRDEEQDAIC